MKKRCWAPIIALLVMAFLVCSCSFSQPQQGVVLNLATQNSGFILAQEKPELAKEILKYSKDILKISTGDFTASTFHEWAGVVMEKLGLDPFLEMNFKEMIKLVNIEIELSENSQETVKLVHRVIQNFVVGINAGIK